jgi:hypothetical protein
MEESYRLIPVHQGLEPSGGCFLSQKISFANDFYLILQTLSHSLIHPASHLIARHRKKHLQKSKNGFMTASPGIPTAPTAVTLGSGIPLGCLTFRPPEKAFQAKQ